MKKRKKMSKKVSKKVFTKTSGTHKKNLARPGLLNRGGITL